jgi:hypothetical protein
MEKPTTNPSYPIYTGVKNGSKVVNTVPIGKAMPTENEGVYRVVLNRPYPRNYFMVQRYKDIASYELFEEVNFETFPCSCGEARLESTLGSYLELSLQHYPPLFMDLDETSEVNL